MLFVVKVVGMIVKLCFSVKFLVFFKVNMIMVGSSCVDFVKEMVV